MLNNMQILKQFTNAAFKLHDYYLQNPDALIGTDTLEHFKKELENEGYYDTLLDIPEYKVENSIPLHPLEQDLMDVFGAYLTIGNLNQNYTTITYKGDRDIQLSPHLMTTSDINTILLSGELERDHEIIETFQKTIDLILTMGEEEHSGDWDPFLYITMRNGDVIETDHGHWEMAIQDYLLLVEDSEESDAPQYGEDCYWSLPIEDIKSIKIDY